MKPFKTFITEEASAEPFHTIKEVPAKKSLLDVHMKLADAGPGCYGKSKIGSEIPDREMKHVQVTLGKQKFKGWGETLPSLEAANLPKSTLAAHKDHIDIINRSFIANGEVPMSVKQVHILYAPRRTLVHMTNGTHEMAMTYSQGTSNGSGMRNYITTNGTKVPASQAYLKSMHTGLSDEDTILNQAHALTISTTYDKTHAAAHHLIINGNHETHKVVWNKYLEAKKKGWNAGMAIPMRLLDHTHDNELRSAIHKVHPHLH